MRPPQLVKRLLNPTDDGPDGKLLDVSKLMREGMEERDRQ